MPGRAAPVPAPVPGPRSPVLLMPTQPAAQLHPLIRAGRKFRFPWAERKEGMLRGNVKSLPSSCFHCLTLTTVHHPFPASPSSPQHASSSEDPSEGRLAEDPAGTVQPCCQVVQGCSRAAGLPWKAPARACTFCRGCISHARPGTRSPGRPWGGSLRRRWQRGQSRARHVRDEQHCPFLGRRFCSGETAAHAPGASRLPRLWLPVHTGCSGAWEGFPSEAGDEPPAFAAMTQPSGWSK